MQLDMPVGVNSSSKGKSLPVHDSTCSIPTYGRPTSPSTSRRSLLSGALNRSRFTSQWAGTSPSQGMPEGFVGRSPLLIAPQHQRFGTSPWPRRCLSTRTPSRPWCGRVLSRSQDRNQTFFVATLGFTNSSAFSRMGPRSCCIRCKTVSLSVPFAAALIGIRMVAYWIQLAPRL